MLIVQIMWQIRAKKFKRNLRFLSLVFMSIWATERLIYVSVPLYPYSRVEDTDKIALIRWLEIVGGDVLVTTMLLVLNAW